MHPAPALIVMDYVGPILGAAVFIVAMSFVREPARRTFNAPAGLKTADDFVSHPAQW